MNSKRINERNNLTITMNRNSIASKALQNSPISRYKYSSFIARCITDCLAHRYIMFELYCKRLDKYFIGYTDATINLDIEVPITSVQIDDLIHASNPDVQLDVKQIGVAEFQYKLLGMFGTLDEVHKYKCYLLNDYLDNDRSMYNDEIFTGVYKRHLIIFVTLELADKIVAYCFKRKEFISVTFNKLFAKLGIFK